MFSSTPTHKKVDLPKVQSGEKKPVFRLPTQLELSIYFQENEFFHPCKLISRDVNVTKKREQFLTLTKMIQANRIELSGDLILFLSDYFSLHEGDFKILSEIVKHEHPFLDSLPFIKKFYTDYVKNLLAALNYQSDELAVDWDNIPEIEPLLKEIVADLASMGVFVQENAKHFPLNGFNLSHIKLPKGSNLSYRNCRHANFTRAVLRGANFSNAKATYATFTHANLRQANFTNAELIEAHFEHADLRGANLQGADLTAAHLEGAKLAGANLAGAVLKGARLYMADLVGWNFQDAIITGALFEQNLPRVFNTQHVTTYLSHNAPSLLHTLDSLPWSYASTKVGLMRNLITRLAMSSGNTRTSILTYKATLCNILFSHPAYIAQSTTIAAFVQNVLVGIPPLIKQTNSKAHYFTEEELTQLFANFIGPYVLAGHIPNFFTYYSNATNQILFACRGKSINIQTQAKKLAELYQNALPQWIKSLCDRDIINLTIDFANTSNNYMMVFLPHPLNPTTLQNQIQNLNKAVICSSYYYETHGLDRDKGVSWTGFQIIIKNATNESSYTNNNHVNSLFQLIPLFKEPFQIKNGRGLMELFLRELDLPAQSQKLFTAAFNQSCFSGEQEGRLYFQGLEGEPRAEAIIQPWIKECAPDQPEEEVRVLSSFVDTMDSVFQCNGDKKIQKVTLVLISSVFARLSSRVFYGTAESSVFFLRLLALACLNTAKAIPNPLLETWNLNHWQKQLQNKDSCSETLSADIITVGRRSEPQIASVVIPTIW